MRNKLFVLVSCLLLTACAVNKNLEATGGSRADGTIELSYDYDQYESPITNPDQGLQTAMSRCRAWGYKDAEAFGGARTSCSMPGGMGGCSRYLVTVKYQCLGNLK